MKVLILIFIISCINIYSYSQGFKAGLLAGLTASQVEGDRLDGYDLIGLTGGMYVVNIINNEFSFQTDIRYIGKGSRKRSKPETGDLSYYRLRLHYVEVPFVLQYKWRDFVPEAGIGFAYLIKALEDSDAYGYLEPDPSFNKYEIPLIVGISYFINDNWKVNARFSHSATPIRKYPGNQTWYFDRGQHNKLIYASFCFTL